MLSTLTALHSFDDDIVSIIVGSEKRRFMAHGSVLGHSSSFFRAALDKAWKEGKARVIELPDDDVDLFHRYLHFLHTKRLPCNPVAAATHTEFDVHEKEFELLARMYVLAEKLQDDTMRNAIIDGFIAKGSLRDSEGTRWFATNEDVDIIYRGTGQGSHMRRLLVDMHVSSGHARWLEDEINNAEFTLDLSRKLLDIVAREVPRQAYGRIIYRNCEYHYHEDKEYCSSGFRKRKRESTDGAESDDDV